MTLRHVDSAELAAMEAEELLKLYKENGDEQVKWEIVLRYEHVVKHAALQVRGIYSGFAQLEDIINEGLITLLKSIDKFDIDKGVRFETFVSKRIRGMVVDLARKQDWVPRNVRKRAKEIDDATMMLANELGRYPSNAELAKALQTTEEKLQKDFACIATNNVVSLEALMDANESEGMHFEIASRDEGGLPDFMLEEQEVKDTLAAAIAALQENERIVLSLYYVENLLLKEIAQVMQVSEPRVSQLHTRAVGKLRKQMMEYYNISQGEEKPKKKGVSDV